MGAMSGFPGHGRSSHGRLNNLASQAGYQEHLHFQPDNL